jgi:hypothetical protein
MDAAGAAKLRWRIEQQEQWRLAESVLDGRQPSVDPDIDDLVSFDRELRVYSGPKMRNGATHLCKRLVDGVWQSGTLEVPCTSEDRAAATEYDIASVA